MKKPSFVVRRSSFVKRKLKNAYTLVEIMIVLSIIGVLMTFVLAGAIKARQKGRLTRAHALLDSVAAALRMYGDDFRSYPPDDTINRYTDTLAGTEGECLYYYLGATFKAGENASVFAGPYMKYGGWEVEISRVTACDFDGDGVKDNDLKEIIDPWGKTLHYRNPPTQNVTSYDLYSEGPNVTDDNGAGDDINNWK